MSVELMEEAIKIAKENKTSFGLALLKRKLHLGLVTCNLLLYELEESGVIKNTGNPKQQYEVLI